MERCTSFTEGGGFSCGGRRRWLLLLWSLWGRYLVVQYCTVPGVGDFLFPSFRPPQSETFDGDHFQLLFPTFLGHASGGSASVVVVRP